MATKRKTVADKIIDGLRDERRKKLDEIGRLQDGVKALDDAIDRIVREQAAKPARKSKPKPVAVPA